MILKSLVRDNHLVLSVQEDILMDNSRDFYVEFEESVRNGYPEIISFHLGLVKFIDSSGIGIIIKVRNQIRDKNGVVNIFGLNKSLHSVFRLSGLDRIVNLYTMEEFLEKYPNFSDFLKTN
ncbi:STAS domain-containing protein [Leptospira fluminis]|uniref:STAS domain-containing protein n=2 Tax=Leptospira TaxID=171 RepID=A0A4R9GQC2_9LEPT|nr:MULTISPECIES: STAS domain-containing protein [Leptospira]TGK06364.1 STAS domain-containing protein [Leptospira fletcheri]TGK18780.1 STAS domain-containing protein [Leptospira fluminis]